MKTIIHRSGDRGFQDHGWLRAAHSFSFGSYHDPAKVHFGVLRVLNDDMVAPERGFGMHAHDNMEIITIPLKGTLTHKDSLGSEGEISAGEVQIMSAGSGIRHSEYNASSSNEVNLLQIWLFPKLRNVAPRYDQKSFASSTVSNNFRALISPDGAENTLQINQDAWFSVGEFDRDESIAYALKRKGNGAYIFIIEGSAKVESSLLRPRDAIGVIGGQEILLTAYSGSKILLIDLPME